ncbi:MAG: ribosome-associated translation inhibitor RaiA [Pirellulales bacterium]|nr:ribosome-associated translation inhibitor RaiA [Pirellulales bacterium]
MQIRISTRHGNISEQTRSKIIAKVERLTRLFDRLTEIEVTIDLEHRDNPDVDLRASAEHKHDFVATSKGGELIASIDEVVHKLEQQLRKYKERIQTRHRVAAGREEEEEEVAPDSETAGS